LSKRGSSQFFNQLAGSSQSFYYKNYITFKYNQSQKGPLYFIVSKKYGNAVQRNLFRRRVRSLYRSLVAQKKDSFGLIVKPLKTNISYKALGLSFDALDKELIQTNKC
jgi:ribonuclease P protein component